jgi:CarD family transcriptional regulator
MFAVGDKIIYGENGVCTVEAVGKLAMSGTDRERIYYTLSPMVGTGTFYAPVDTKVFMRSIMSKREAEDFLESMAEIEPAICHDVRFTHVDAFYKELFREHTCQALVAMLKGIYSQERSSRSNRIDMVTKRAKEILNGELSVALGIPYDETEEYVRRRMKKQ